MKMKLFAFALIVFLGYSQSYAQGRGGSDPKVGIGIQGGVNLQNLNGTDFWGDKLENDLTFGFHGGVSFNLPVAPDFFVQPGILFITKGTRREVLEAPVKAENSITNILNLSYIEVPVNLLFRPQLGDGHILLGFGPYAAYGIVGKMKTKTSSGTTERDVKFKNIVKTDDPSNVVYFRGFDAGANIFFGYELFNGIFFQLNAQLGLLKVNPEYEMLSNDKTSYKNTGFGLSAGYRF